MTERLKTVEYWFPMLPTVTDAADTNFAQITIDLPESSKNFRSVVLDVQYHSADTTLGNVTRRQLSMRIGASAYSVVNATQTLTSSGEQFCAQVTQDFTTLFNTSFTGTSHTVDARVLLDASTASSLGFRNVTAKLSITYSYDDAAATHVKTAWIPLEPPRTTLPTTKSAGNAGSIPALDTFLPENSVSIKQATLVVQGNTSHVATTDISISSSVGALANDTSQLYEGGANSDMWFRYTNDISALDTASSQDVSLWASLAKFNHPQAWAVVTYTFASNSPRILNSLLLPIEVVSPMGDNAARYNRTERELFVQEPGTITTLQSGVHVYWDQLGPIAGLNMRIGSGSFLAYTDAASTMCGGNGASILNNGGFSLSHGRNTFGFDIYRTDAADLGYNVGGLWMINYSSDRHPDGVGAHNHTVVRSLKTHGTAAAATESVIPAIAPDLPENEFFYNAIGLLYQYLSNSTSNTAGASIQVERLVAEGGFNWEPVYTDLGGTDPEVGVRTVLAQARTLFKRWPGDPAADRMTFQTPRRWKAASAQNATTFDHLDYLFTYHSITYPLSGTVTGYTGDGSGITVNIHRASSGEKILTTTTSAGGNWSVNWYDDTEPLFATAVQGSNAGRSLDGTV